MPLKEKRNETKPLHITVEKETCPETYFFEIYLFLFAYFYLDMDLSKICIQIDFRLVYE